MIIGLDNILLVLRLLVGRSSGTLLQMAEVGEDLRISTVMVALWAHGATCWEHDWLTCGILG